ncbi:Gfo/Idh/MocA family oxidoreductase [Pantoea cypripedii]|uniref:Gfo/Idh/MocA family protein n=1 Tax=Pantoea cypripedii TaxID=55209 RepID=UPI002FC99D5D
MTNLLGSRVKWGILAPGRIAHKFASDLLLSENSEIISVVSRDRQRAMDFAQSYAIPEIFSNYEEFYEKSSCDVVYIASPHVFHKDQVLSCLNAGKSVVCEKPIGISADEAIEMVELAKSKNLFFMEAMWTRFFPVTERIIEIVDSGAIGAISMIKADFCFRAPLDYEDRLYNPALGGGSLLDAGVYPITYAQFFFKTPPLSIKSERVKTSTGVDGTGIYILRYPDDKVAILSSSILTKTPYTAMICGTDGYITVEDFLCPNKATIQFSDGRTELIANENIGNGYIYEIMEVEKCLARGEQQSTRRTHAESIDILKIMDAIQKIW